MIHATRWSLLAGAIAAAAVGCGKGGDRATSGGGSGSAGGASGAPVMTLVAARVAMDTADLEVETTEDIYGIESKTTGVACDREVATLVGGGHTFACRLDAAPFGKVEVIIEYRSRAGAGRLVVPLDHRPYLVQRGSDFTCAGVECQGRADVADAELTAADGTRLTYGGVSAVVTGGKPAHVLPELWPEVEKLSLAELRDRAASRMIAIPLTITFTSGVVVTGERLISRDNLLAWVATWLARVQDGPVLFPGEAAGAGGGNALLALYGSGETALYGAADELTDIGRIAVRTLTRRGVPCGKYIGEQSGEQTRFGLLFVDETYTIYDRRTGKRQATRRFAAPPKACPERFLTSGYGEALVSTPEPAVVIAWLRKQAG